MESYQLRNIHIGEEKESNVRVYTWGDILSFCDVYMEEGVPHFSICDRRSNGLF